MRHYEIIVMIHPDQSDKAKGMIERYTKVIEASKGTVHRIEDWGRRQLAYPILKLHKAHYALLNIECDGKTLAELKELFRFNDAVLRNMIIKVDQAETEPSAMITAERETSRERGRV